MPATHIERLGIINKLDNIPLPPIEKTRVKAILSHIEQGLDATKEASAHKLMLDIGSVPLHNSIDAQLVPDILPAA